MTKPLLLDLFCKAGGASKGYALAGFDVTGVDIEPQPNYPFRFVRADALDYVAQYGWQYSAITASPPCQTHSRLTRTAAGKHKDHGDFIWQTRFLLEASGKPYIIENVQGAPLRGAVMLCGSQFGLKVYRHRFFESNVSLTAPDHTPHRDKTPPAGRGRSPKGFISITGGGIIGVTREERHAAMGINWMTNMELSQAIPPAYTHYLGLQLMRVVRGVHILERQTIKVF